jgi:TM2 domain-containing membrane protein YozV
MDERWYVHDGVSDAMGPMTTEQLMQWVRDGRVPLSSRVCALGASEWVPLATHPSFASVVREVAPPPPLHAGQQPVYAAPPQYAPQNQAMQAGHGQQPMQPYGQFAMQPGHGPYPVQPYVYGAAPIHIVVQNTVTAGSAGGLVRVGNRNRTTAGVLAIFFGAFGVHKFYLGQPILGLLYLLMSWTFIPMIVGFIEGLVYLASSEQAFDMKHNARLT